MMHRDGDPAGHNGGATYTQWSDDYDTSVPHNDGYGGSSDRILADHHRDQLLASAISPEIIDERGYWTAYSTDELADLEFSPAQRRVPALVIPIKDVFGQLAFSQIRPDVPRTADGKRVKYETPAGKSLVLDVPSTVQPLLRNPTTPLWITEGSKKVDAARSHLPTIAILGVIGVWSWRGTNQYGGKAALPDLEPIAFNDREVYLAFDSDVMTKPEVHEALRRFSDLLKRRGAKVRYIYIPSPTGEKVGLDDYLAAGGTLADLIDISSTTLRSAAGAHQKLSAELFHAHMLTHKYIFTPTGELWPASSVNGRVDPIDDTAASKWLDRHRPVEQVTWAPGLPQLIEGRLVTNGGWIDQPGARCFNQYRPPQAPLGNAAEAERWVEHVKHLYSEEADHLIAWFAHRVQHPGVKINHAAVLGGPQGIGKDTMLEAVKRAVGSWNVSDVSPITLIGRFNSFTKSVLLCVSEARDLGDVDRYGFYEHTKTLTAAPPEVMRVDEKHLHEYYIPNVCGVVITTNHKADGIYLPADDRRHFVAWSERKASDFSPSYWNSLYAWYDNGGYGHVAAYLAEYDLSDFDPKAPPPKTDAFWSIVDASRAPEDAELADALDRLKSPDATTLDQIAATVVTTNPEFAIWIKDRKNRRRMPHRLEAAGYVLVRNDGASDGMWRIEGKRQNVYAKRDLSLRDRISAANRLIGH